MVALYLPVFIMDALLSLIIPITTFFILSYYYMAVYLFMEAIMLHFIYVYNTGRYMKYLAY